MTQVSTAVTKLADQDVWIEAGYIAGGFFGPTVVENVVEGQFGFDAPSELYGAGSMVAEYYALSGKQRSRTMGGSGLFVLDALLERAGLKQTVVNMGA
jgi:hypothetical protein